MKYEPVRILLIFSKNCGKPEILDTLDAEQKHGQRDPQCKYENDKKRHQAVVHRPGQNVDLRMVDKIDQA